jgi:glycine/D-amino acid oxidase-like deaminating enzyme
LTHVVLDPVSDRILAAASFVAVVGAGIAGCRCETLLRRLTERVPASERAGMRQGTSNAAAVWMLSELPMNQDYDPLIPMGVQSAETVQVEAAERARKLKEQLDRSAATAKEEDVAKAEQAAGDVAEWFRVRSGVAAEMAASFVRDRPLNAMLIACAAGALLMGVAMLASKRD